jgi:hypothetical protein
MRRSPRSSSSARELRCISTVPRCRCRPRPSPTPPGSSAATTSVGSTAARPAIRRLNPFAMSRRRDKLPSGHHANVAAGPVETCLVTRLAVCSGRRSLTCAVGTGVQPRPLLGHHFRRRLSDFRSGSTDGKRGTGTVSKIILVSSPMIVTEDRACPVIIPDQSCPGPTSGPAGVSCRPWVRWPAGVPVGGV